MELTYSPSVMAIRRTEQVKAFVEEMRVADDLELFETGLKGRPVDKNLAAAVLLFWNLEVDGSVLHIEKCLCLFKLYGSLKFQNWLSHTEINELQLEEKIKRFRLLQKFIDMRDLKALRELVDDEQPSETLNKFIMEKFSTSEWIAFVNERVRMNEEQRKKSAEGKAERRGEDEPEAIRIELCPICQDPLSRETVQVRLHCYAKHIYHLECLESHIRLNDNASCPECRQPLAVDDLSLVAETLTEEQRKLWAAFYTSPTVAFTELPSRPQPSVDEFRNQLKDGLGRLKREFLELKRQGARELAAQQRDFENRLIDATDELELTQTLLQAERAARIKAEQVIDLVRDALRDIQRAPEEERIPAEQVEAEEIAAMRDARVREALVEDLQQAREREQRAADAVERNIQALLEHAELYRRLVSEDANLRRNVKNLLLWTLLEGDPRGYESRIKLQLGKLYYDLCMRNLQKLRLDLGLRNNDCFFVFDNVLKRWQASPRGDELFVAKSEKYLRRAQGFLDDVASAGHADTLRIDAISMILDLQAGSLQQLLEYADTLEMLASRMDKRDLQAKAQFHLGLLNSEDIIEYERYLRLAAGQKLDRTIHRQSRYYLGDQKIHGGGCAIL
jgi:hypothetical protein